MGTNEELIEKLDWNNNIKNKEEKEVLARKIASKVKNGDVISFGSGTTSFLAVKETAKKCRNEKIEIKAVVTSKQIELLCQYLNIPIITLDNANIDWGFDGADEVDSNNWLIKGGGACMYKEKMNIKKTPITYILVDSSKIVNKIGEKFKVPVECDIDKIEYVKKELIKLGAIEIINRKEKNSKKDFITENGKKILDVRFENIDKLMEEKINEIDGVLENGLFLDYKNIEIIYNN